MKKRFLLTIIATIGLTTITFSQMPNYVSTDGLVGWWPFNGNANDESGNGNNGFVNGAILTTDRFGIENKAYSFDGMNDFIEVNDHPSLRCRKLSISVWVFAASKPSNEQIVYKGDLNNAQGEAYSINGTLLSAIKINSNCKAGKGWIISYFNQSLESGRWKHLLFTFNGDTIKDYIDGVLVNMYGYSGLIDSCSNSNLRFGFNHLLVKDGDPWNGSIDDIGIWNRALNQQEISDLYDGKNFNENVNFEVWPNPTNDFITVDVGIFPINAGFHLKLINVLGQQLNQFDVNQKQFNIEMYPYRKGMYFIYLVDEHEGIVDSKKIVLQ